MSKLNAKIITVTLIISYGLEFYWLGLFQRDWQLYHQVLLYTFLVSALLLLLAYFVFILAKLKHSNLFLLLLGLVIFLVWPLVGLQLPLYIRYRNASEWSKRALAENDFTAIQDQPLLSPNGNTVGIIVTIEDSFPPGYGIVPNNVDLVYPSSTVNGFGGKNTQMYVAKMTSDPPPLPPGPITDVRPDAGPNSSQYQLSKERYTYYFLPNFFELWKEKFMIGARRFTEGRPCINPKLDDTMPLNSLPATPVHYGIRIEGFHDFDKTTDGLYSPKTFYDGALSEQFPNCQ